MRHPVSAGAVGSARSNSGPLCRRGFQMGCFPQWTSRSTLSAHGLAALGLDLSGVTPPCRQRWARSFAVTCSRSSAVPRLLLGSREDAFVPRRTGLNGNEGPHGDWRVRGREGQAAGRGCEAKETGPPQPPHAPAPDPCSRHTGRNTTMDFSTFGPPGPQAAFGQCANRESVLSGLDLREPTCLALSGIRLGGRQDLCPDVPARRQ